MERLQHHLPQCMDMGKVAYRRKLQALSQTISSPEATTDHVGAAGVKLFIILYGGKDGDTLTNLHYKRYMEIVSTSKTTLEPQKLSPTERAAYFQLLLKYTFK